MCFSAGIAGQNVQSICTLRTLTAIPADNPLASTRKTARGESLAH
jgi:hypothetical protein